jgi:hypothetical protein
MLVLSMLVLVGMALFIIFAFCFCRMILRRMRLDPERWPLVASAQARADSAAAAAAATAAAALPPSVLIRQPDGSTAVACVASTVIPPPVRPPLRLRTPAARSPLSTASRSAASTINPLTPVDGLPRSLSRHASSVSAGARSLPPLGSIQSGGPGSAERYPGALAFWASEPGADDAGTTPLLGSSAGRS